MIKVKKTSRKSKLSIALSYAKRGWAVVRLYTVKDGQCTCAKGSGCKRRGKHPMTKHGVKNATTKPKVIKRWWKEFLRPISVSQRA
jgi:bifunctional DNA primase/polymerase-like protein